MGLFSSRMVSFSLFAWSGEVSPKKRQLTNAQGNSDTNNIPFHISKNITHSDGYIRWTCGFTAKTKALACGATSKQATLTESCIKAVNVFF